MSAEAEQVSDASRKVIRLASSRGRVTATGPEEIEAGVYWRLEWYEHNKREQTTGGLSRASAEKKMASILDRLDRGSAANGRKPLSAARAGYAEHLERTFSKNHVAKAVPVVARALGHLDRRRCDAIEAFDLIDACNAADTPAAAKDRKSKVSAFLTWGKRNHYFTRDQARFLEDWVWSPSHQVAIPPLRKKTKARSGESERFVTADQVPTHGAVAALGDAFDEILPYGKLLIEHVHSSGYRSGEMYAASADSIHLAERLCEIDAQALSLSGLDSRRALPKHGRTRTTNYPDITTTGFALHDALGERLEQVDWEHRKGTNPMRLLYPAKMGGYWWATSFTNDFYSIAATEAGFERQEWTDAKGRPRKQWVFTMHSLRHRFARDRIDHFKHNIAELQAVGGWQSAQVVWERYYGQSKELVETSTAKLRSRGTDT